MNKMTFTENFKKLKETDLRYKNLNLTGGRITEKFKDQIYDFIYNNKNMLQFIQNEYKIYLDDFYCGKTYGGLITGLPDKELNDRIIGKISEKVEKMWGKNRKVHVVMPEVKMKPIPHLPEGTERIKDKEDKKSEERLPPWLCMAWLRSPQGNEGADGSYLILAWFCESERINNIYENVSQILEGIDWKETAVGYFY